MSQENNSNSRKSGGQGRQGGNNRNRNRNRNRSHNRPRNAQGESSRSSQGGNRGQRRRQPKVVPLTLWEKILKFLGLYKSPTRPPRRRPATEKAKAAPKSNVRNARGKEQPERKNQSSGPVAAKGRGAGDKGKDFPVETPRLYLGNLSYDATEHDLEELFKGVGTVKSVEIIYNRHTHRSRGYGFIEMLNLDEAQSAVEVLHDQPFMGRNMIVNGASSKPVDEPEDAEVSVSSAD